MTDITLTAPLRKRATNAIEAMHTDYHAAGGIGELGEQLRVKIEGTSKHIFGLAQYAAKKSNLEGAITTFRAMCLHAEDEYKKAHQVSSVREALPSWATLKSYVLRGMTLGLDPNEYETETKFRAASAAKIGRDPGAAVTALADALEPPRPRQRAGPMSYDEVESFVATTTIAEPLRLMVSNLVYSAEIVKPQFTRQAEEILRRAWQEIGALVDRRKLK